MAASISATISIFSPSFPQLQKPMIATIGSPYLRLPSISKAGKVRCSVEDKPLVKPIDDAPPTPEDDLTPQAPCPGKNSWPELVGKTGEVAAAIVEKENPLVNAIVILDGTPTPRNFSCERVWVWVNTDGVVIRTPVSG
ncbi:wound-induced proteinase inhibitor 1 isoform X2 [Helianthus annuus]|uniref:wound-induced proteinase inhibitor 1 isoform X2 n=1 Tax=Helianthus annuus TaxID=4232 RepID=UPI000B8FED78|nr:wound-induced proteinase inhibitor 1 isoform X2 [Helianthus annuus]